MTTDEALTALVETLEQLRTILPVNKESWDSDLTTQLAVERLWITAGNTAEEYRRAAGVDDGVEPWSELAAYRNQTQERNKCRSRRRHQSVR